MPRMIRSRQDSGHGRRPTLLVVSALGLAVVGTLTVALVVPASPASAIIVYDPTNYSQNLLTAARSLQQINNQISALQNDATMLINQARNLATISFPELAAITDTLHQIDRLMGKAAGITFQTSQVEAQFRALYPRTFDSMIHVDQRVTQARGRLDTAMTAYQHTMAVQARVVENVSADAATLSAIAAKSQGAQGALQAQQATNQLLALTAKQQFQIQALMAAQYRADTIEQARRVQAQADARGATRKFLGSGSAYTPH